MVLIAGAIAGSGKRAKSWYSVRCRMYLLSARRLGMIPVDWLVHEERSSTRAVEVEFGLGRYRCHRRMQHGSPKSTVVRCEQLRGFVEERRGIEVLMAELTADWMDTLERRLEHWKTVGSW